jgi:hypothetical protein
MGHDSVGGVRKMEGQKTRYMTTCGGNIGGGKSIELVRNSSAKSLNMQQDS